MLINCQRFKTDIDRQLNECTMNLISEYNEFFRTLLALTTHQMCSCDTENQVTSKHLTSQTPTNLFNTKDSSLLGHNGVINGKMFYSYFGKVCHSGQHRQPVCLKWRQVFINHNRVTSQKTWIIISTTVRTSNFTLKHPPNWVEDTFPALQWYFPF
jgi:hypothetical protein